MKSIPTDYDLALLNDGCGMHADNIRENVLWYPMPYTRTCCSYLITDKCCSVFLESMIPFSHAIDAQINVEIKKHDLKTYWAEPTLVHDGSETIYSKSYQC
jgi:hypothetical protein